MLSEKTSSGLYSWDERSASENWIIFWTSSCGFSSFENSEKIDQLSSEFGTPKYLIAFAIDITLCENTGSSLFSSSSMILLFNFFLCLFSLLIEVDLFVVLPDINLNNLINLFFKNLFGSGIWISLKFPFIIFSHWFQP